MTDLDLALLQQQMMYLKEDIAQIKKNQESMESKIDQFLTKADERYASKKIESALYRVLG